MKLVWDHTENVIMNEETGEQVASVMPRERDLGPALAAGPARVRELEDAIRDLLDNLHLSPEPGWVHVTEERVKLLREALAGRMECPICGAELIHEDSYGRLCRRKVLGQVYRCPNGLEQDGSCDSGTFSVAGSFYTDPDGALHEGYPC